jgi:hypothetical protein
MLRIATIVCALLLSAVQPARAQIELTGTWNPLMHEDQPERGPGPDVGDYAGLPITEAARMRALTWNASLLTVPEHQCKPHPANYGMRGVGFLRISADIDDATQRVTKINTHIQWMEQRRQIWMDGRPHPPEYAAHMWQGFSTGRWDGNVLEARTTHLKASFVRRNGVATSDQATMTERFIRHGDYLTHVYMIQDPYYLSEPLIKTSGFRLLPQDPITPYPCEAVVEVPRPRGSVPHMLPGTSHYNEEYAAKHQLPIEGVRGGAATAYPEFMKTVPASAPANR